MKLASPRRERTTDDDRARARRRARTIGLLAFSFAAAVSVLIFFTQDSFDAVDILFIVGMPPAFGAGAYFVGLYHSDDL